MTDKTPCIFDLSLGIRPSEEYIASYIKERREANRLTHQQLAYLLGVSRTTVINYEKGIASPNDSIWLRALLIFNEHPRFILTPRCEN